MFQELGYPCIHALAILYSQGRYDEVMSYVSDGYLRRSVEKACFRLSDCYEGILRGFDRDTVKEAVTKRIQNYHGARYDFWEDHRLTKIIESRGESELMEFSGRPSKKINNSIMKDANSAMNVNDTARKNSRRGI